MRKTTADRLTSADINHVVRLVVTAPAGSVITDVVGLLLAVEENNPSGKLLHIGVRPFEAMDHSGYSTVIYFPEDD